MDQRNTSYNGEDILEKPNGQNNNLIYNGQVTLGKMVERENVSKVVRSVLEDQKVTAEFKLEYKNRGDKRSTNLFWKNVYMKYFTLF